MWQEKGSISADELFAGKPEQIAMLPTGQAFIIKQ